MIGAIGGFALLVGGLYAAFRVLRGHRLMATYDPARGSHEGHDGPAADQWGQVAPPVEPINTWTNLAYYVAGWVVAWQAGFSAPGILFGIAMTWLSVSSALFHGTLTRWGQLLDHGGMFGVFGSVWSFSLLPTDLGAALMLPTGLAGALFGAKKFEGDLNAMMGILALPPVVLGLQRNTVLAAFGAGLILAALVFNLVLDRGHVRFLGRLWHGIWHLVTAAGIGLLLLAQVTP